MITREYPPASGGIGFYVLNLSRKLIERGHEVTVITRGSIGKYTKENIEGITVFKVTFIPVYPFHIQLHSIFVNSLLEHLKPDLIHVHTPVVPPIKTKLPVVATIHTLMKIDSRYHEVYDPYSLIEKIQSMFFSPHIESETIRRSNKLTAVSPTVANEIIEYGMDPAVVTTVWNGVDEKRFSPLLNPENTKKYILYAGVLRARKGLFDLLECAEQVCKANKTIKFLISGTGPYLIKLQNEIQKRGLKNRVILLGYVDRQKLIHLYQNATLQVIPSHYEGLPTVLLEAMACGLPVVATEIGGHKDVISNGVNGFLVPPKNPQIMAETILKLLEDHGLMEKVGKEARKTIEKYYTWEKIADNFEAVYEDVLRK
jgi:glycosyltransferase involved in cell wall biosynthesis